MMRALTGASALLRWRPAQEALQGLPPLARCSFRELSTQLPQATKEGKVLHPELLNTDLLKTKYAVRGEIYLKAEELRQSGKEITFTNIGNPQALGQSPITFYRQVLALCAAPFLIDHPYVGSMFPSDAIARAKHYVQGIPGGVGAYSDSRGVGFLRQEVANFIERRDGHPANPDNIFLTDGASVAVRLCLNALIRSKQDGLLCPIPQYPLYSAGVQLYGGTLVGYELDEKSGWGMSTELLKASLEKAKKEGVLVRGLVFINPGNPTGQVLSEANLKEVIKFAYEEKLVLMADEVYQENIYTNGLKFISAKKVLMEMGAPYTDNVELLSFHTVSKGMIGECGLRGGYVEMTNIHPGAVEEMYKISSLNLCPNLLGQVVTAMMCNPPQPGEESYEQFYKEKNGTFESMKRRAKMLIDGFKALEGIECNETEGAMYAFPQLILPPKALEAAAAAGRSADEFYCLALLEDTGIVTVPGAGFGQVAGTYHFRTTILPKEEKMPEIVYKFAKFHKQFMAKYS